jgi:hypothetical protein
METKSRTTAVFSAGMLSGALGVLVIGAALLYGLNMSELVAISVLRIPNAQRILEWTYENLRLSVLPFTLTFFCYLISLRRLKRHLRGQRVEAEKVAQTDHMVEVWINLFFGIGVIWTAIGMRGALLEGLGGLNPESAARLGAFSILQRLVDGGILLALSTTIFGAIGGYLLRLAKSLTVGRQLKTYYNQLAQQQTAAVRKVLQSIDDRLAQLVAFSEKPGHTERGRHDTQTV